MHSFALWVWLTSSLILRCMWCTGWFLSNITLLTNFNIISSVYFISCLCFPSSIFWPFMATGERVVALGCEWSTWNIVLLSELIGITMFLFISFYQWNYQLCSSWFFFWLAEKDFTVSPCPKGMGFVKLWGHAPASEYGTFHLVWPNGLSGMAITAHDWVLACKTIIFLTHITG